MIGNNNTQGQHVILVWHIWGTLCNVNMRWGSTCAELSQLRRWQTQTWPTGSQDCAVTVTSTTCATTTSAGSPVWQNDWRTAQWTTLSNNSINEPIAETPRRDSMIDYVTRSPVKQSVHFFLSLFFRLSCNSAVRLQSSGSNKPLLLYTSRHSWPGGGDREACIFRYLW